MYTDMIWTPGTRTRDILNPAPWPQLIREPRPKPPYCLAFATLNPKSSNPLPACKDAAPVDAAASLHLALLASFFRLGRFMVWGLGLGTVWNSGVDHISWKGETNGNPKASLAPAPQRPQMLPNPLTFPPTTLLFSPNSKLH